MIATGMAGCGCGQRGDAGSGCGCGRAAATGVVNDGAFTRPRFFEGQLLTSDDLQALGDYGRGKDRLHNRYLVGSGVVCGLEVVCSCPHPGSVVVGAGYALDCCGNDIVVACDQLVDVNELVRALPADAACADPCPPATKSGNGTKQDGEAENSNGKNGDGKKPNGDGKDGQPAPRHYELVVEYAETPTDLVAPYSTGEETSKTCEPTRVREGYRFSLRCVTGKPARPPQLVGALACCAEAEDWLAKLERASDTASGLAGGGTAEIRAAPSQDELDRAEEQLRASPDLPTAKDLAAQGVRFAQADDAASAVRAFRAVSEASRPISESIKGDTIAAAEAVDLDKHVTSLLGRVDRLEATGDDQRLAEGVVSGQQVRVTVRSVLEEARDWALCWLEQRPGTHCRALEDLAGRPVPSVDNGGALLREAKLVTAAVRQILIDCLCAAVNPPCAPCDDEAVVLAKVTVECCEVVEICNLARRHAVTGTALRYWLPLEWLYCELEKACCGDADKVTQLDHARDAIRSLAEHTDCGWPKRWADPRGYRLPVQKPQAVALPDSKADDGVKILRARMQELERRWESLQPPPPPAAASPAAAVSRARTTRPTTTGRARTTRPTTTSRATTTSRTSATREATPAATKATDAAKKPKNTKAATAGKATPTRKAKSKPGATSGNGYG